jgi:hypothetical protein
VIATKLNLLLLLKDELIIGADFPETGNNSFTVTLHNGYTLTSIVDPALDGVIKDFTL